MKTLTATGAAALALAMLTACGDGGVDMAAAEEDWTDLSGLDAWTMVGEADWRMEDGEIVGEGAVGASPGFLMSPGDYDDFELTLDFWISEGGNSGVYFRCEDGAAPTDTTCYEANIFDDRPDQSGRTGAIVNIAPPMAEIDADGQWNTYRIRAEGDHLVVELNGETTVDAEDSSFASGPIGLQVGAIGDTPATVRFRNVQVRKL